MSFEINAYDNYTVAKTKVEKLDSLVSPDLKSELVVINKGGCSNIIIDMSETRYCDSSGLSAVLVANRLCNEKGGCFVLTGLQPAVAKIITISQLDNVLNITPTLSEAVDFVMMDAVEKDLGPE